MTKYKKRISAVAFAGIISLSSVIAAPKSNTSISKREKNKTSGFHVYEPTDKNGENYKTYIIETPNKVVLIDNQILRKYEQEVSNYVNYLNKPVDRIIATSVSSGSLLGSSYFKDIPVYTTKSIINAFNNNNKAVTKELKKTLNKNIVKEVAINLNCIDDKSEIIDGIRFNYMNIPNSYNEDNLLIHIPELKALVYNNNQKNYLKEWGK